VASLNGKSLDERALKVEIASAPNAGEPRKSSVPRRGVRRGSLRGRQSAPLRNRGPASDTVVFLGNLPYTCTDSDLKEFFGKAHAIIDARIVSFKTSGRSKGFGFITAADHETQKKIIAEYMDAEIDGRKIIIRAAYSEEPYDAAVNAEAAEAEN
jgi:RNA recognition motif-containing protein